MSYTVHYCKNKHDDSPRGLHHASKDAKETLCGKQIDERWYISNNTGDGKITCPRCLRIQKKL